MIIEGNVLSCIPIKAKAVGNHYRGAIIKYPQHMFLRKIKQNYI